MVSSSLGSVVMMVKVWRVAPSGFFQLSHRPAIFDKPLESRFAQRLSAGVDHLIADGDVFGLKGYQPPAQQLGVIVPVLL